MPTKDAFESTLDLLQSFFQRPVAQTGTRPLRDGVEIALYLEDQGPVTLVKQNGQALVLNHAPQKKPDMTFHIPCEAAKTLSGLSTDDVGEVGVEILKLMAHSDPAHRVTAKVHIGAFDLLRNGYLGVIPLGGPTVMKFLASKGFNNIGKIRDAISRMRS